VVPQVFDGFPLNGLIALAILVWLGDRIYWAALPIARRAPSSSPPAPRPVRPAPAVDAGQSPLWDRELDG